MGMFFTFLLGVALFSSMALIPPMLQRLYGYPIITAGLITAPRGIGMLVVITLIGRWIGRVDARIMIISGMAMIAWSMHAMTGLSLEADAWPIVISGSVQGIGLGLVSVPLNTIAFTTISPQHRTDAASLFNLMRNVGSSLGISIVTVLLARNLQVSHADMVSSLDPAVGAAVGSGAVQSLGGDVGALILGSIDNEITRQAAMVSYVDDFYLLMWGSIVAIPLVMLMRSPKRAQGDEDVHVAIE